MIKSRPLALSGDDVQKCRPHRLEAQDATLSRSKPGFESPWGHKVRDTLSGIFYF